MFGNWQSPNTVAISKYCSNQARRVVAFNSALATYYVLDTQHDSGWILNAFRPESRFEPWGLVSRHLTPFFDVRFRGYGQDKIQYLRLLNSLGFGCVPHFSPAVLHTWAIGCVSLSCHVLLYEPCNVWPFILVKQLNLNCHCSGPLWWIWAIVTIDLLSFRDLAMPCRKPEQIRSDEMSRPVW